MTQLSGFLSYPFMVHALIVGLLVSVCCALLGVSLVLRRYSMIGDGLSHVGFGALAIATVAGMAPLALAIPVVVLSAFVLLRISEKSKIRADAAIALISTGALAIGVMAVSSEQRHQYGDFELSVRQSILALSHSDVVLSVIPAVIVLLFFIFFYHRIFAVTFDETFAKATGVRAGLYNTLTAMFTALTVVLGMRDDGRAADFRTHHFSRR